MQSIRIPPRFFNGFIILAVLFHFILPIRMLIHSPYTLLGIPMILLGLVLNSWSVNTLTRSRTTIEFDETPVKLVTEGPFGVSRNPIYLSGLILLLGVAMLLGSLIAFVFPLVMLLILDRVYIPSEERRMARLFGHEYRRYKQRVRRWI